MVKRRQPRQDPNKRPAVTVRHTALSYGALPWGECGNGKIKADQAGLELETPDVTARHSFTP